MCVKCGALSWDIKIVCFICNVKKNETLFELHSCETSIMNDG